MINEKEIGKSQIDYNSILNNADNVSLLGAKIKKLEVYLQNVISIKRYLDIKKLF